MSATVPNYTPNLQHRNAAFAILKSQWVISIDDEVRCFHLAFSQNWEVEGKYWSIHINGGRIALLGKSQCSSNAYIAKFVGPTWHGYPTIHWRSPYDRPPSVVLQAWKDTGYLRKTLMSKIIRGKKCAL